MIRWKYQRTPWAIGALAISVLALAIVIYVSMDRQAPSQPMDTDEANGVPGGMAMGEDGEVRLTPDRIQTFGITFGVAERRGLQKTIRAVGLVEFDETRMAWVAPKFGGWVERLHVDFEGQSVRRGQPLFEIYSSELVSAQEELLLAVGLREMVGASGVDGVASGSDDLLAAAIRRLRYWDISDEQIERLIETRAVQKTLTLHAPVSGIVMKKNVFLGQAVGPGDNLYMIADLSEVWIEAELFESDAALVAEGMAARIEFAAFPGLSLDGRVEYVYPTLDRETRSMKVRIAVPNPDGRLKPGMFATVKLETNLGEVLAVPRSAVLQTGEQVIAFVDMGEGRLLPVEVRLGIGGDEYAQILDGLTAGQRVVTSAQFLLDSESNLADVMKAMMAQMSQSDTGREQMKMPTSDDRGQ